MGREFRWDTTIPPEKRRLIDRVQRRFREHVRTKSKPWGRIHRERCCYCVRYLYKNLRKGNVPAAEARALANQDAKVGEFHHLDYHQTFLGIWVCESHHRMVEHGSLRVNPTDVWDYSSVVRQRPHLHVESLSFDPADLEAA